MKLWLLQYLPDKHTYLIGDAKGLIWALDANTIDDLRPTGWFEWQNVQTVPRGSTKFCIAELPNPTLVCHTEDDWEKYEEKFLIQRVVDLHLYDVGGNQLVASYEPHTQTWVVQLNEWVEVLLGKIGM